MSKQRTRSLVKHNNSFVSPHPVVTMAGTETLAEAGCFSLSWLSAVINNQGRFPAHGTITTSMYIIRLIGFNLFAPTVSLARGQKGD